MVIKIEYDYDYEYDDEQVNKSSNTQNIQTYKKSNSNVTRPTALQDVLILRKGGKYGHCTSLESVHP